MKINFFVPHLEISGGIRVALNYAHFLAEKGHDVQVVFQHKNYRKRIKNILEFKRGSIREFFDNKPYWYRHLKANIAYKPKINNETLADADILVAMDYSKVKLFDVLDRKKGVRFEFIMHDERLYHGDKEDINKVYKRDVNKICVSSWLQGVIKKDFNQESDVLINPIDTELFFQEKSDKKKENDEIIITMMHHNYEWKGVEDGVKIFNKVKKETGKNLKLVLFGCRFKKIDIQYDEYYYDSKQEDIRKIYSDSDIFLCTSEWEGLGLPAMEAMCCKTAVVTYDTGGSRDYAFDNDTAFVAQHSDLRDLENKLKEAVIYSEKRDQIAQNGYKFITQKIDTWAESVEKMEKIFNNKLAKRSNES